MQHLDVGAVPGEPDPDSSLNQGACAGQGLWGTWRGEAQGNSRASEVVGWIGISNGLLPARGVKAVVVQSSIQVQLARRNLLLWSWRAEQLTLLLFQS